MKTSVVAAFLLACSALAVPQPAAPVLDERGEFILSVVPKSTSTSTSRKTSTTHHTTTSTHENTSTHKTTSTPKATSSTHKTTPTPKTTHKTTLEPKTTTTHKTTSTPKATTTHKTTSEPRTSSTKIIGIPPDTREVKATTTSKATTSKSTTSTKATVSSKSTTSSKATTPSKSTLSTKTTSTSSQASRATGCSVWSSVAADLKSQFSGCNSLARQAIRLSFHDCFAGACDGSIILANECHTNPENRQMTGICDTLGPMATKFNVGVADLIQFGTAIGTIVCRGPPLNFKAGRRDSSVANTGPMPSQNDTAESLVSQFAAKGLSSNDLVALVGAHTTATTLKNVPFDTSPTVWDNVFYGETQDRTAPASLDSDLALANSTQTKAEWTNFANDDAAWGRAFQSSMVRLANIGVVDKLIDCSSQAR